MKSLYFLLASDLSSQKPVETGVGAGGFFGIGDICLFISNKPNL